ncbi:MAG: FtsX-like permease family protein [Actinomycetota bacterium]
MFRLTIKNLAANRIRLALTTFAVVLAVAFVVSALVLTDGLRSSFGDLSEDITAGTDLELRPVGGFGEADTLPETALDDVSAIDGVDAVAARVEAEMTIRPVNADGETISINGPPQLAFGWIDDPRLANSTMVDGRPPTGPAEFTMDLDAAATHGFDVGQTYQVITPTGTTELELTGLTSFGADNDTLGATLMHLETATLQGLLGQDGYDSIAVVVDPAADRGTVEVAMAGVVPGAEVVDQATLESEQRAEFDQGIDILGNILLGFAGVSLFVSIFIIYNTFSIVLGQRTRELALMRTVGADPAQIRRSVLGEAAVIGVVASAIGIVVGLGLTYGLRGLFGLIGADLPDSPLVLSTRTVIAACVIGIVVTLVSAIGPARKAGRIPPVAALRDGATAGSVGNRLRMVLGGLLTAAGVVAGSFGLFVASTTASVILLLAAGAIGVFVGVTMLSPLVAVPVTRVIGWPLRRTLGASGHLAQQNAGRNPQRTATTAAALMIGLAVVSMTLTVGESVKAQFRSTLESSVRADYLAIENASTFPPAVAERFTDSGAVDTLTRFRYDRAIIDGVEQTLMGSDLAATEVLFDIGVSSGVATDPSVTDAVLVANEEADALGIEVGDTIPMTFESGTSIDTTVIGIFEDNTVIEEYYLVDLSTFATVGASTGDDWLAMNLVDGVTEGEADAVFAPIAEAYPGMDLSTTNAFVDGIEDEIDQALAAVNVMVVLAVVIALIGIANTLALSVFERTRELGLLRAVGMTRRQLRRMIRLEAALVAVFGAALGVAVGVLFGWAAVAALPATVTDTLAIPVTRIVILVAIAGVAGLVAAWGPARRAGRLKVLDAIAS